MFFYFFAESGLTPINLKFITLRIIAQDTCARLHSSSYQVLIHNSTLCTFIGYGAGTCHGDSGGPLVINNQLVGVLSWGEAESEKRKPDQFTRISEFTEWIQKKTGIEII